MSEYSNYIEARDAFVSAAIPARGSRILFQEDLRRKRIAFAKARDIWEEYLRRHPVLRFVNEHEEAIRIDFKVNQKKEYEAHLEAERKERLREESRIRKAKERQRFIESRRSGGYDVSEPTSVFIGLLHSLPREEYNAQAVEQHDLYYYLNSLAPPTGAYTRRRSWHSAEHQRKDWHDPLCG